MKKMYIAIFSVAILALTSCAEKEVSYKLDSKKTTLNWTGKYAADAHTHKGTVNVSEGTMTYKGDEFVSGNFKVDLNSIENLDLEAPINDTLVGHLKGEYFFNIIKNSDVDVKINKVSENEINATITVLGQKLDVLIPSKIKRDDKGLTAKGKFEIDFSSTKMLGFKAAPGDPENQHVEPVIAFEINLELKK